MMKEYLFVMDFHRHTLKRVEQHESLIPGGFGETQKITYVGGSVRGLVYRVIALSWSDAVVLFYNHLQD